MINFNWCFVVLKLIWIIYEFTHNSTLLTVDPSTAFHCEKQWVRSHWSSRLSETLSRRESWVFFPFFSLAMIHVQQGTNIFLPSPLRLFMFQCFMLECFTHRLRENFPLSFIVHRVHASTACNRKNEIGTARKRVIELIEVKVLQRGVGMKFWSFFARHDALRVSNDGWYQPESLKLLFERRSAQGPHVNLLSGRI